jgi:hypothetical protein
MIGFKFAATNSAKCVSSKYCSPLNPIEKVFNDF